MLQYQNRIGTHSRRWDDPRMKDGMLSLWVADMDFKCPQGVLDAISKFNDYGIYGYYIPKDSYYDAFIDWEKDRHQVVIERDWIRFAPGVVPGINWVLEEFTQKGDAVMLSSPVYFPFYEAIRENERTLVENELAIINGRYEIDFEDFEKQIAEKNVKLYIFCNPHNPVGRVWEKESVEKIIDICKKHHVLIIADEIHQDFVYAPHKHISMANCFNRYDNIILLTSGGKSFNIAAVQNALVVIPNKENRVRYDCILKRFHILAGNIIGYIATEAAYREGKEWLEEVKRTIYDNYEYVRKSFAEHDDLYMTELEGTYLLWLKILSVDPEKVADFLREDCNILINDGQWFGGERYKGYFRLNLATPKENIEEFVRRLKNALKAI